MPFIVDPSNLDPNSETWIKIPLLELTKCRYDFTFRHRSLSRNYPNLDFESDISTPIELSLKFLNPLIQNASFNHYFVAHYICDGANNNYQNLNIAICIKEKGAAPDGDDEIRSQIYHANGTELTYAEFWRLIKNYEERRKLIATFSNGFSSDREGRAHEITQSMKDVFNKIALKTDFMYAYFILDDYHSVAKNLSVAFSDKVVAFLTGDLEFEDDAYDHGAACCPIG